MLNPFIASAVYLYELMVAWLFFSSLAEKRRPMATALLLGFVLFESGAVLNLVMDNNVPVNAATMILMHLAFGYFCFQMKLRNCLFYCALLCAVNASMEVVSVLLISALTGSEVKGYNNDILLLTVEVLTCKTLYFIWSVLLARVMKRSGTGTLPPFSFLLYPLVTEGSILAFYLICIEADIAPESQYLVSSISTALCVATMILALSFYYQSEKDREHMRIQSEYRRLQTEKAYYDILDQQNQQLRIFAHDTRNHLAAIQSLNKDPKIAEYVAALSGSLESYSHSCQSGNVLLDVILGKYTLECQRRGIQFDYNVAVDNLKDVEDMDLVSILGNLLDNALEAAGKTREKKVSLETICRNGYRVLIIRNSSMPPEEKDGTLLTSKPEGWNHGFGLKSVRKTLKKYQGDLQWDYDRSAEQFTMTVMIGKNK